MSCAEIIALVENLVIPASILIVLIIVLVRDYGRMRFHAGVEAGKKFHEKNGRKAQAQVSDGSGQAIAATTPFTPPQSVVPAVTVVETGWLRRVFRVVTPEGCYLVEYNGRGLGYESVLVDGVLVKRLTSLYWFVPRFWFKLGPRNCLMKVRVSPWLSLHSVEIWIDGRCVFPRAF
jgi:hypothetical protein